MLKSRGPPARMPHMNLALISHVFPNPAAPHQGTFILEKAAAIARRTPLQVCAPVPQAPGRPAAMPSATVREGLQVFHPTFNSLPRAMFSWQWQAFRPALRRFFDAIPRPDILLLDWIYPDAYAVMEYCRAWGVPMVITTHGANAIGYYSHARRLPYYTRPLQQAARVIAVSADLQRRIMAVAGIAPEKIQVIPNGVNTGLCIRRDQAQARAALNLPAAGRLIVTVARLAPEKALHLLLQALNHSHRRETRLAIIGEGPLRRRLQQITRRLRLAERVNFLGGLPRAQIPLWMAAADVFALSSLHEGDPVVIREALACGTPVVAPRVGGIPEIVNSGQYGLLCEPNDSLQLAHRLDEALEQSWDAERISRYGRQYSWDDVAVAVLKLCRELLAAGRPGGKP